MMTCRLRHQLSSTTFCVGANAYSSNVFESYVHAKPISTYDPTGESEPCVVQCDGAVDVYDVDVCVDMGY